MQQGTSLLACSGGLDSICLAHLLLQNGVSFEIAHVNFNLRGDESDGDAAFVKVFADKNGVKAHFKSVETQEYASEIGISIEMAARELRYAFFNELMKENHFQYLLTAHHLNDDVETLLLKTARGSSLQGVSGIKEKNGYVLRPLLALSRKEIELWAVENAVEWREDSSNASDDYLRNKIRHHVVPVLEESFPNFYKSVGLSLNNLKEENEALQTLLGEKLELHLEKTRQGEALNLASVLNKPYLKSLLRFWLSAYGVWDLAAVTNLVYAQTGAFVENESWHLLKNRNTLLLAPKENELIAEVPIHLHDNVISTPVELELKQIPVENWTLNYEREIAQLDFEKLEFPLILRCWQDGDQFVPLGMSGFKKLSDFLIDEKVDRNRKNKTLVLCSGLNIVWVLGHRIDERFKVGYSTKTVYFAHLKSNTTQ